MNESLKEKIGDAIVNDKVCLGLLSCDKSQSLLMNLFGRSLWPLGVSFGAPVFRQIRRVQRKLLEFGVFEVTTVQNNHYTKLAYLGCHILLPSSICSLLIVTCWSQKDPCQNILQSPPALNSFFVFGSVGNPLRPSELEWRWLDWKHLICNRC